MHIVNAKSRPRPLQGTPPSTTLIQGDSDCYCLGWALDVSRYYAGNDLNEDRTPVEAGLTWTIGKRRREACDFLGGEVSPPSSLLAAFISQAKL